MILHFMKKQSHPITNSIFCNILVNKVSSIGSGRRAGGPRATGGAGCNIVLIGTHANLVFLPATNIVGIPGKISLTSCNSN